MNKRSIVVAGLLLALTQGCQPSASQRAETAIAEARSAVIAYGRKGSVAEKQKAAAILRDRVQAERDAKEKKRQETKDSKNKKAKRKPASPLFGSARLAHKLSQIRKGSPDPDLAGGPLTDAERAVLETVNDPISEADVKALEESVRGGISAEDVQTRLAAAERLFAVGEAGLPTLAMMMRDVNSNVAATAAVRFVEIVGMISDDRETAACAKAGMLTTTDPVVLEKLGLSLVTCADNRPAVTAAIFVIENGTPEQSAAARDAYSSITGDEWTDKAAAENWIKENCDPEEDNDEAVSLEALKAHAAKVKAKTSKSKKEKSKK